jgi:hypothetical protein
MCGHVRPGTDDVACSAVFCDAVNVPLGLRPKYNADFCAAGVRDPDVHKLAAPCRCFTQEPPP